jgi:hypothetical protein
MYALIDISNQMLEDSAFDRQPPSGTDKANAAKTPDRGASLAQQLAAADRGRMTLSIFDTSAR